MNKETIKKYLTDNFLSEAKGESKIPGLEQTKSVQKQSDKINKDALKSSDKAIKAFDKGSKAKADISDNKFTTNGKKEKDYHDEMEILNGQEMVEYDREPNKEFKDRAKEAIEGSSRMGNEGGIGNAEAAWGASDDDFGKKLAKTIKTSTKKRTDADDKVISFGDDIEVVPKNSAPMAKHSALSESFKSLTEGQDEGPKPEYGSKKQHDWEDEQSEEEPNPENLKEYSTDHEMGKWAPLSDEEKERIAKFVKDTGDRDRAEIAAKRAERLKAQSDSLDKYIASKHGGIKEEEELNKSAERYRKDMEGRKYGTGDKKNPNPYGDDKTTDYQRENNNNNKPQIKESMKRLNFKKEFNGVGNALKMIPESYRTDKKEFEMTDGVETYRIRWEGTLTEGRAQILLANDKKMLNEDLSKMKHLMGYKSQETLGTVKGNARLNENMIFNDMLAKTKTILESEEIEGQTAPKGEWEKAKPSHAKEAKADVEGSVSTDKGTKAPKPKSGEWEEIDTNAPEATADVEGSVSTDKGTKAPKPKEGYWEEIKPSHASEAKKHVTTEGVTLGDTFFAPINENYEELMEEEEEVEDEEEVIEETENIQPQSVPTGEWDKIKGGAK